MANENKLLEYTVELTKSALCDSDNYTRPIYNPDAVADFMQAVYDKLKEINGSAN